MPPKRCTSCVCFSTMASIMSSTVTMPMRWPTASTTGRASRSYFRDQPRRLLAAGGGRDGERPPAGGDAEDVVVGIAGDQPAQGHGLRQRLGARVEDEDRVDRLAGLLDGTDMVEGLLHRPVARHADEFRGHQRAHALLAIGAEPVDRAARLRIEPRPQIGGGPAPRSRGTRPSPGPPTCRDR